MASNSTKNKKILSDSSTYGTHAAKERESKKRSIPSELSAFRQSVLDLGPESTFDLTHGNHKAHVAIGTGRGEAYAQRLATHEEARACVGMYEGGNDVFISQSGFRNLFHRFPRSLENLAVLPCVFIDLDVYNVGLPGDAEIVLSKAFELHPWLPMPTIISNSGRGCYFQWVFKDPLPKSRLSEWQQVEDALIEMLMPLGADPAAKDASRMLRIVGSVNSKSNAMVTGNLKSDPIQFERFKCFVLDAYREFAPKKTRKSTHQVNPEDLQDTKQSKATSRQRAQGINPYKLAQARIDDLSKLVELRGGKLTDGRHRFLYVFAICSTWFRGHVDDVAYDCEAFAHRCFADSSKYDRKRIGTILDRHQRDKDRVVVNTHNGERVPNRYRMRTDTIIRILGITPTEERYMATLIGSTERNRRREERRRAQGVKPRTEYLKAMASRTESTAERVSALAGKGMSASLIAEVIGLSKRRVNQIIAKANQCDMFS